uniref:Venom protein n=1 Tax=Ampulex compressa TaxID=860918 RepID=A0A1W6EVS4_AMPCP|nr:venom protein [Ampulex compressa]
MSRRGILLLSLGSLLTFNLADGYSIAYPDISEKLDTPVDPLRLLRTPGGIVRGGRRGTDDEYESWPGRWMPDKPNDPTPPPKVLPKSDAPHDGYKFESSHRIQMGRPTSDCDDAKTNLTVDWDRSPIQHTCYDKKILPNAGVRPLKYCEYIPKAYRVGPCKILCKICTLRYGKLRAFTFTGCPQVYEREYPIRGRYSHLRYAPTAVASIRGIPVFTETKVASQPGARRDRYAVPPVR